MILLGLTRRLGALWRAQGLPDRTVEFVLFDAEEQGLVGSGAYTYFFRQGAIMPRPILMIDEEQSGTGYPVRPFGLLPRDPAPAFAITTDEAPPHLTKLFGPVVPPNQAASRLLLHRLQAAIPSIFAELQASYPSIPYRGGDATAFQAGDEKYLKIGPDPLCCSDNLPFETLGLATLTLAGNGDYYNSHGETFEFPFDQPQDTPAALACDTGGSPAPGVALQAALDLPLAVSFAMVQAYAPPADGSGVAIISSAPGAGVRMRFQLFGAARATWNFGDGETAHGPGVAHVYTYPGRYRLMVHAGAASTSWSLVVPSRQPAFFARLRDLRPPPIIPWHPAELQNIPGCN
jgi:hypothetical protein